MGFKKQIIKELIRDLVELAAAEDREVALARRRAVLRRAQAVKQRSDLCAVIPPKRSE